MCVVIFIGRFWIILNGRTAGRQNSVYTPWTEELLNEPQDPVLHYTVKFVETTEY